MSSFLSRIWSQQQFGYVPHTSVSGETWQFVAGGTDTAGTSSTVVTDSSLTSGGTDAYNGRYWIKVCSGSNKGEWKRIVDDDAAGVYTVESTGFSGSMTTGDTFEIWKSPEPVIVVDSSSGATNVVDAIRSEANDYWNDYYVVPITGTYRGEIGRITDFVSSTGTFTIEAQSGAMGFSAALAAGDVCLLRRFVEIGTPSLSLSENYVPRPSNRVNFSRGDGSLGARGGSISFTTQIRPNGTTVANDAQVGKSDLAGLFQGAGLEEVIGLTTAVGTVGTHTTTLIYIPTAKRENLALGQMIIYRGNPTFITTLTDGGGSEDSVTVAPALPVAPTDSDQIEATRMYKKTTDGDEYGVTLEWEVDGVRTTMTGCKGNVTYNGSEVPELSWDFQVDHYAREIEAAPYNAVDAYSTVAPVQIKDQQCWLSGTATSIGGLTATPGTTVAAKNIQGAAGINGRSSFQITNYQAGGTWRELLDSATATLPHELRWTARTSKILNVAMGCNNEFFGISVPAAMLIESPHPSDEDGLAGVPNVFEAQDAGTGDVGGTATKLPDFAFHIS
jgi:hypothetical protein